MIDPCQGSGHILVYLFEVLMQIYREEGHSERDAARSILEHNLYGLDIDDRAYQLSYFAVLMKAREYDRMILKKQIEPHVYSIQESNTVDRNQLKYFGADMNELEKNNAINQLTGLLDTFIDAKEYGSILNVDPCDWDLLRQFVENDRVEGQYGLDAYDIEETQKRLLRLIDIGEAMGQKYHAIATNPPYMSVSSGNNNLNAYVKKYFPASKADLFSVCIEKFISDVKDIGYLAMITMEAWMFLSSYEKLRLNSIKNNTIVSAIHMPYLGKGRTSLGINFGTVTFCICKYKMPKYKGQYQYIRYYEIDKDGIPYDYPTINERFSSASMEHFKSIPGMPIAYWASETIREAFKGKLLSDYADPKQGLATGSNDDFLRLWFEVSSENLKFDCLSHEEAHSAAQKWYPCNKGGDYRKWYGNNYYVVNWQNDGQAIKSFQGSVIRNEQYYFKEGLTWSTMTSGDLSMRYSEPGHIFESKGSVCFLKEKQKLHYILAFLNSAVVKELLTILSPTLDYHEGPLGKVPVIFSQDVYEKVLPVCKENVLIEQADWDEKEISWNYKTRFNVTKNKNKIEVVFEEIKKQQKQRINIIKRNEELINREFIRLYGLEKEISPEVDEKKIALETSSGKELATGLVAYAVGCMFGRYSLDVEGLAYAGGDWQEALTTKYKTFLPDEDAIIPITDEEYFKDDIVARFVDFVRIVYGEETLEENLNFIADALGNKGDTSRAVIRNYFLNDFYKDHCNTYSVTGSGKRPIYWLFDSGKQNGFKALIYIHRYTPDTVGLIRSKYLHNAQAAIQNALQNSEYIIASTTSATERAREMKKRDKYVKQLNELRPYYQALTHIALQRIPMNLDDGVKKNYQLFQNVEISTEGKKKQSINLLAKI